MKPEAEEYLHLHYSGSWGFDGDVWIFPDDSFVERRVKFMTDELDTERKGVKPGAFQRIVSFADRLDAWGMTSESLEKDLEAASKGEGPLMILDSSSVDLDFKLRDKEIKAGFYAADSHAERFPKAKQIRAFARLEKVMWEVASAE